MKKSLLVVAVLALAGLTAVSANAQEKFNLGVGADVLVPVGDFGDGYKIGFGGTVRGQYDFTPMLSGGATLGYFTWSAKDVPAGVTAPSFSGLPIRVYGKYYFMPPKTPRVYGMFELGMFFWSWEYEVPSYTIGGQTFGGGTISETGSDFNIAPGFGVEIPAGSNMMMDISGRYDVIMTSGSSSGNLAVRVGLNFMLGN
jgi:hypothetical protein